ncbi:substrate-binding periplasmic protein [Vibrio nitrifigilis]|uniref:Transporter substrate-binding domain-containing protein n=1 Tax=Vibrio nitrifigilis TaxID=2789781 RepID=A0ABS0GEH0_9VIBR|nr:transporter substrate-binding domain-containing protein [Vibrio nitrifigilis]MBF9000745.1 transporter substrate-binding domain-containing protein [Vibrio nitrifigilis]
MRKLVYFLLVITHSFFSLSAFSQQLTAVVGLQNGWPPYVIDAERPTGLSVQIVSRAFALSGYYLDLRITPWSRALKEVQRGADAVLIAAWYSEEREQSMIFSDPYLFNEISFITLRKNPVDWGTYQDLVGKSVGVIRNYAYDADFMSTDKVKKIPAADLVTNIRKLQTERIDLIIEEYRVALWTMRQHNIPTNIFQKVYPNVSYNGLYVAAGKLNPNAQKYITAFNAGLKQLIDSGELQHLIEQFDEVTN